MTSNKMPLILDNTMGGEAMQVDLDDVDDLFGDGAPLALPPRPPSKRLRQRLDDLRSRGSCQGIVWSKTGTIASITPDGQQLQLRYVRADTKDASFSLSEPTTVAPWGNLPGGPLVHLSWGPSNSELAVIDAVGRVLIFNFNANINRPALTRKWDHDPVDDLHAIVGTYWLHNLPQTNPRVPNTPPYTPSYAPAIRNPANNSYNIGMTPIISTGPWHPHPSKSALVCITTNGTLKMFWGQINGQVQETTLELENITFGDDLITHAAVCSDRTKTLIIAMATASNQLRIAQVGINWGIPKPDGAPNVPPGSHTLNPTLSKRHVTVTNWFQPGTVDSHLDASMPKISHMEILPSIPNGSMKEWYPVVVLTVRSFVPEPNSPYTQEVQSIIDRWEFVSDQQQTFHPAFEQLGARRNSERSSPPKGNRLKKLESIVIHKIILGVHLVNFTKVICFTFHDGSVEYRDRFTMDELYREPVLDRIYSIMDVGFSQSGEPSCLQTALSPTNFSLVQLCEGGQVKWRSIDYTLADLESMTDVQVSALVAGFTISTAQAAAHGANIDDILAVARHFVNKDGFAVEWVIKMVSMMKIAVDYTEDAPHDHLIKNSVLQMCLSIINYLGWRGNFQPRQAWGKLSMLALNLRNIVIMITLSSNTINLNKNTMTPLDEPEVVNALAGCVKWSTDLLCWLCDSLFCLFDDAQFMKLLKQPQLAQMTQYLHEKNEIALHLVLCSATRGLLSAVCRRITLLDSFSTRAISWYENRDKLNPSDPRTAAHQALYAAYQRVRLYTSSSLIKADEFDKLLTTLGADIRSAYNTSLAVLGEQAARAANNQAQQGQNANAHRPEIASQEAIARGRQHCELQMLVLNAPPMSFVSVIDKFFNKDLKEFRAHSEVAKLYFSDYSILEINDGPRTLDKRRRSGVRVDLFKRIEISKKPSAGSIRSYLPWRACARCGSVMEDLAMVNNKPGLQFLLRQQFICCCGGRMALLPQEGAARS
ncbi:RNA polymerase II mediator complex subunit Sin4 [Hypoxylon cercidicola]|nr:RNA polymerase II mediator complex subunit Sin4 [Hypoxylon cercidicola]